MCSETCVGRIRYLGVLLYDADKIGEAAATPNEQDLYQSQLDVFLDPHDPAIIAEALKQGIPQAWVDAAAASPVYKMAVEWKVAFPLHPEYRTLPMVWYVPPLSPIQSAAQAGHMGMNGIVPDVKSLRIPVRYLLLSWILGALLLGLITITESAKHSDGEVMVQLMMWAQHLLTFQGDAASVMLDAPWLFKLHMMMGMTLFVIFPFTRLVHVWSGFASVTYLIRPWQLVRNR